MYAGGLRHHSAGPLASAMYADGSLEAMAIDQLTSFQAGMLFCETEGILPAPEAAHAVAGMMDVVSRHPRQEPPLVVLVNISGHGLLDLGAYRRFADGEIEPVTADEASLSQSLSALEEFNQAHRGTCGSNVTAEDGRVGATRLATSVAVGSGPGAASPAGWYLSRCGSISPRRARSTVCQRFQWAGLLRMAALTSATQRPNAVAVSPSSGTGAEISHTWWR